MIDCTLQSAHDVHYLSVPRVNRSVFAAFHQQKHTDREIPHDILNQDIVVFGARN
jgi:hypothetical protein